MYTHTRWCTYTPWCSHCQVQAGKGGYSNPIQPLPPPLPQPQQSDSSRCPRICRQKQAHYATNTLTCASMVLPVLGAPYSSRLLMCGRRSWTTWLPRGRMANSATAWRTCKGDAQMQKPYGGRCDLPKSSQRPHSASAAAR